MNAVCPGMVWTAMQDYLERRRGARGEKSYREIIAASPFRRDQMPEGVGWTVVFLASEEAKDITGQSMNVDGGSLSGTFR